MIFIILTTEPSWTSAVISGHKVDTDLEGGASDSGALVNVVLTSQTVESIGTLTGEIVAKIALCFCADAAAGILTRLLRARVVHGIAVGTHELGSTLTCKSVDGICTGSSIAAGVSLTLIDVYGAGLSRVSRSACATEPINLIMTGSSIGARIGCTLVDICITILAVPSCLTIAAIATALIEEEK